MTYPQRARSIVHALATATTGILVASCILVVSPETYGERCRFDGEDTSCGRCIRDRCQPAVDACCREDSCGPALVALEGCAARRDGSCEDLVSRADRAAREGELAACAATKCGAVCRSFLGTSETSCREPLFGRGATCECTPPSAASGAANDFECSPLTYPGTVCCAPSSWPAEGLECTCQPLGCSATPDGCYCQLRDTPPEKSECSANKCCAKDDQCACCGACFDGERPVTRCSTAAEVGGVPVIGCRAGQIRVDSCSIRRPR